MADLEQALYEERSLLRVPGMRKTLFVVTPDMAAAMQAACNDRNAAAGLTQLVGLIERQGLADDGSALVGALREGILASLAARGEAVAADIKSDVTDLDARLHFGAGKDWEGSVGLTSRVLYQLTFEGSVTRAHPRGTWRSGQYHWALLDRWHALAEMTVDEAAAALLTAYLTAYGPATTTDIRWWTGWTVARMNEALSATQAEEVELEDGTGWVLPGDDQPEDESSWVGLLPGLDPSVMGWKEREWLFSGGSEGLFDRNGNAGPTVWVDGCVVGGWAQRDDGSVVTEPTTDLPRSTRRAIHAESERLQSWLDGTVITHRFPSPMERALKAGPPRT